MSFSDLLFPKRCVECGKHGSYICESCIKRIGPPRLACPMCSRPSIDGMTHSKCLRPHSINGAYSLWGYNGVVRKAILGLKYKFASQIAEDLVEFVINNLEKSKLTFGKNARFTTIPLYWRRENWRGFNQSELMGRAISSKLGWDFKPDLLKREKFTRPQTELRGKERKGNIRGVFSLNPDYQSLTISHQPLILFDDVWTTGATIKEAAKVLKRNGAKKVWGLTLART